MTGKPRVLVVDDEEVMRDVLSTILSTENYSVDLAESASEALGLARENDYGVVLLDLMLPDSDGLEVLAELKKSKVRAATIILTAYGTIEKAVRATRLGAFDFITKPFKNDELLLAVRNALELQRLQEENQQLRDKLEERHGFGSIIGKSAPIKQIFELISQVAPSRSTVLIEGESGTGKELVAKAIHGASGRGAAPFVAINCGNIPSELLESELFGHVRGAYTGATSSKKGLFEVADGGTLFLDEVSNISIEIQAKLLRVIQEREFRRLGALENVKVDVRIIAATNSDLHAAVRQGAFREDLYYRLNVIFVKLPPLRERPEDIPLLIEHFVRKYSEENRKPTLGVEPGVLRILMDYHWPGNVRELENVVERAVVLSQKGLITAELLPKNILASTSEAPQRLADDSVPLKERVLSYERGLILTALEKTDWNQKKAAELLRVNATTLSEKLKRLNIKTRTAPKTT